MQVAKRRTTILLTQNAFEVLNDLKSEWNLNNISETIEQCVAKIKKQERRKSWIEGINLASQDEEYLREELELSEAGVDDGIE